MLQLLSVNGNRLENSSAPFRQAIVALINSSLPLPNTSYSLIFTAPCDSQGLREETNSPLQSSGKINTDRPNFFLHNAGWCTSE